jgi:hypothetical protein
MTSESTRFLGHPSETIPIFKDLRIIDPWISHRF